MKTLKLKKIVAVAVAAMGIAAMAEPKVEITRVDMGNARDGVFAYTYNVSGVESGTCTIDVKISADKGNKAKTETITSGNGTGSYSVDTKSLFDNVAYADVAVVMSIAGSGSDDDSELWGVQLWPDGPYWAACNVGAASPGQPGCYFQWGDTIGYRYVNGKWTDPNGVQTNMFFDASKPIDGLCPTFNLDVNALSNLGWLNSDGNLKAWCDAATVQLGASWRMPTSDEVGLLTNPEYCTSTWTNLYGTAGRLVTGVKEGYTNKSIFLPAAGYGEGSDLQRAGTGGYYISSTPDSNDKRFICLIFEQNGLVASPKGSRSFGCTVRPVRGCRALP